MVGDETLATYERVPNEAADVEAEVPTERDQTKCSAYETHEESEARNPKIAVNVRKVLSFIAWRILRGSR